MKTIPLIAWFRRAAIALAAVLCAASPAWADKYASIVIDMETGQVLHDRAADEARHPASLTKVMTLYMVFDAIESGKLKLSDRLTVSKAASRAQPSKLGLKAGSTIKVEDAIRALVTKSANDVAIVIAEKLGGGSEAKFVTKMNAQAKELGMDATTFRNASGLPDKKQITTARDMAKLAEAVYMDHKDRYNYFSLSSFTWGQRKYMNHNELLRKVDGVDGIKTGFTNASGYNLMASAERGGRRVIAIMLGGKTGKSRDAHVRDLIEAAFLEIGGGVVSDDDLRTQIAFGERGNVSADDLALAQLRRLQEPDAALVASLDNDAFADAIGTTEEGEESLLEEVSEGDGEGHDPIGDLIEASPAPAPAPTAELSATPVATPITTVAAEDAILVTSEAPSGAPAQALDLLDQPTAP
jgi:D-alanyl-D-alanine carboxypeptidase